jgi:hypothetical protein
VTRWSVSVAAFLNNGNDAPEHGDARNNAEGLVVSANGLFNKPLAASFIAAFTLLLGACSSAPGSHKRRAGHERPAR